VGVTEGLRVRVRGGDGRRASRGRGGAGDADSGATASSGRRGNGGRSGGREVRSGLYDGVGADADGVEAPAGLSAPSQPGAADPSHSPAGMVTAASAATSGRVPGMRRRA
jgi:hypothetical protein